MNTIYKLINKLDGSVVYVGKTVNMKNRMRSHKSNVNRGDPLPVYKKIRAIGGWDNIEVVIDSTVKNSKADSTEVKKIAESSHTTSNQQTGGAKGYKQSASTKKLMSEAQRGEKNTIAKLTESDVIAIRADARNISAIARDYGVARTTIRDIKSGKNWKHVPM